MDYDELVQKNIAGEISSAKRCNALSLAVSMIYWYRFLFS